MSLKIKDEPAEKRTGSTRVVGSAWKMDVIASPFEWSGSSLRVNPPEKVSLLVRTVSPSWGEISGKEPFSSRHLSNNSIVPSTPAETITFLARTLRVGL